MSITVIIPCYNESIEVLKDTVTKTANSLSKTHPGAFEILVINDGSKKVNYDSIDFAKLNARMIKHDYNQGYGASLMTGVMAAAHSWIGIADSDGTYPIERFHEFMSYAEKYDMVIGKRPWKDIPLIRRPAKMILHKFACFMAGAEVEDLNTGMRIFRKEIVLRYKGLFPKRFSFTSTLTMIHATSGQRVKAIDIDYAKRVGSSSIRPIADTIAFFSLVLRLSLYFNPLKIFIPLSFFFLLSAIARGVRDYNLNSAFGGLTLVLFFMGFQLFFFGLIAEVINRRST
ncbi:MAG TPA: glycosyltransferase family 2 protein [Pseudobdellovibrionaceae bacterium]|jgi:glycosyltransferase involved in cell wall biosynthesis